LSYTGDTYFETPFVIGYKSVTDPTANTIPFILKLIYKNYYNIFENPFNFQKNLVIILKYEKLILFNCSAFLISFDINL